MKKYRLGAKRVKVVKSTCPICDEVLGGNGSIILPYSCKKCSLIWNYNVMERDGTYLSEKI